MNQQVKQLYNDHYQQLLRRRQTKKIKDNNSRLFIQQNMKEKRQQNRGIYEQKNSRVKIKQITQSNINKKIIKHMTQSQNEQQQSPKKVIRSIANYINQKKKINNFKFSIAILSIYFIAKLKRKVFRCYFNNRKKAQKYSSQLIPSVNYLVKEYYHKILSNQMIKYIKLLKIISDPSTKSQVHQIQILNTLTSCARKLSSTSVNKNILQFFVHISTQKSFPPDQFLSIQQLNRLQFNPKYRCLVNVDQFQTRMIVSLGLGIKIFVYYVLMQPWNFQIENAITIQECLSIRQTIHRIASIFYFIIMDLFCDRIKPIRKISKNHFQQFQVRPIFPLDPFQQIYQKYSQHYLIVEMSPLFIRRIEKKYPEVIRDISQYLNRWLSRISYAVLKQKYVNNIQYNKNFATISTKSHSIQKKNQINQNRKIYKSVELQRSNKKQMILPKLRTRKI